MTEKGEKSAGKEDILRSAQPGQAPEQAPASRSIASEARSLGKAYWIRVSVGFLFVIFFSAFVPNLYLQYRYSDVFAQSPCKLCHDLNNQTEGCFFNSNYSIVPETSGFTWHPIKELGFKAHWLQAPCDTCGMIEKGELGVCLNQTFAPRKEIIKNKYADLNLSNLNFTP